MSDIAIRVENLSKQYRIGGPQARYKTIRESLTEAVQTPFRRLSSIVRGQSSAVSNETIWALKDVSFEVQSGEVVGIIGRNGAGKTTLLKVLSRITEPTEGYAEVHGRMGSLLEVGTGFHPELTGRENIFLNGAILGMRRAEIECKFEKIVGFSGVRKFIDTPVKHYSSGMQVRLAFSVAAHLEPEILLVDEVLAVGDAAFQEKCLGRMGDVAHAGHTVLFVSHNMPAITSLCERAIWIDQGSLKADGNPTEIVQRYLETAFATTRYQEGFMSLADHADRKGDGTLRLTHIRLLDAQDVPVSHFRSGQAVKIAIGYQARQDANLGSVTIGFAILNRRQQFITYCQNGFSGDRLRDLPPSGEFVCELPKLPLMPGHYTLNLRCRVSSAIADRVSHAGEFEVIEGEFYPTELLPPSAYGDTLFEYHWSAGDGVEAGIESVDSFDGKLKRTVV